MSLFCPHCQCPIEVVQPTYGPILCPSCGSSFRLEQSSTMTWELAGKPKKVGKFELLEMVGAGAYGSVFKARDTELDRIVAVKVPRLGGLGSSGKETDRFLREARSVAQLRHPSIVAVHEVGQHEGVPFLVEDFVPGVTLADLLTSERLPAREAAMLVAGIADALQYAHDHGVIHRDIKPSNIMLETRDEKREARDEKNNRLSSRGSNLGTGPSSLTPRLMDFGLAKRAGGEVTVTTEGQVLGTPAYMSPEQARGESHQVDGRSDVYSLGVILYELLAGEMPFRGNPRMLMHHVLNDEPKPPRKRDPLVPRDLETICLKAMAKEPAGRYATARELAEDLRRFLSNEPILARPATLRERGFKWVRRRPAVAALIALFVVVIVAAAAVGTWVWKQEQSREETRRREAEREAGRVRAEEEAKQLKIQHFANVVRRWGALEGVGPVTPEEAGHRENTHKFYSRGGKIEKVEIVNGAGVPVRTAIGGVTAYIGGGSRELELAECRYDYRRDHEGRVVEESARNRNGRVKWIFHTTFHGKEKSTGQYTNERGFVRPRSGSGAAYVEIIWTPQGGEKEIRYLDRHGRRVPIGDRTYGKRQEFDSRGLVIEKTFLGPNNEPIEIVGGTAKLRYRYDAQGNLLETAYFGLDGKMSNRLGYAKHTFSYDAHGNIRESNYLGADGKLALHPGRFAKVVYSYDERGNETEKAFFGLDGKPAMSAYGFARSVAVFDERGNWAMMALYDAAGKLSPGPAGLSKARVTYDSKDNPARITCLSADGEPAVAPQVGYAMSDMVHDERGRTTEIRYLDAAGKPMLARIGYAKVTLAYDELDNIIDDSYFGLDGKLTRNNFGFAKATRSYDDRGNQTEAAFYGPDGKLTKMAMYGYARWTSIYDVNGNQLETALWDTDGRPAHGLDGYSSYKTRFDKLDRALERTYTGYDGKSGYAQRHCKLDDRGREAEETFLDAAGKPVSCKGGFARAVRTYDRAGWVSDARYFDVGGSPVELDFVRDWLVLAPIPLELGQSAAQSLAKEQIPGEAKLGPKEGDRVRIGGKELVWTKYRAKEFFADFNALLARTTQYSLAYAVSYVSSDAELRDILLKVGSDDQIKVYLNGEPVLTHGIARLLRIDDDIVPGISLRKGTSVLVLKVVNESQNWSACARFTTKDGKRLPNVKATWMAP